MSLAQTVSPQDLVFLTCPNHPGKRWWTTTKPGELIHFHSEVGKKPHHGLIPPFKTAVKEVVSGRGLKRDEPIDFTPGDLLRVCQAYIDMEAEYAFECDCPTEKLVRYTEPEVG